MNSDTIRILEGDCREVLASLPAGSVHCCVTSPPYYGLRDYGVEGQLGLESSPDEYVESLVGVMREVHRVLRDDGTLWLVIGDSYASGGWRSRDPGRSKKHRAYENGAFRDGLRPTDPPGIKPKDMLGIPWLVALALRADGWYLRQDIVWHKPNAMPESVTDRCTRSHEYVFLLSKSERYYYDSQAIAEPLEHPDAGSRKTPARFGGAHKWETAQRQSRLHSGRQYLGTATGTRNRRSVWSIATQPFRGAHFATFPPKLAELCILAGTSAYGCCERCGAPWRRMETSKCDQGPGWTPGCECGQPTRPCTVLDPFGGAGTTGLVAARLGRNAVLVELNPAYAEMARGRIAGEAPLLTFHQDMDVSHNVLAPRRTCRKAPAGLFSS